MGIGILVAVALATALLIAARHSHTPLATNHHSVAPGRVDHAERTLARRYAMGEISSAEYEWMLRILQRP